VRWSTKIEGVLQKPLECCRRQPPRSRNQDHKVVAERAAAFKLDDLEHPLAAARKADVEKLFKTLWPAVEDAIDGRGSASQQHEARR